MDSTLSIKQAVKLLVAMLLKDYSKALITGGASSFQKLVRKVHIFHSQVLPDASADNYQLSAAGEKLYVKDDSSEDIGDDLSRPTLPLMPTNMDKDRFGQKFVFIHEFLYRMRTKSALNKIKKKIVELQRMIDAPKAQRPSYGSFVYDVDSYFIEIDKKGVLRLIETEKGRVQEVRRAKDLDELLYWIFTNITWNMACKRVMEEDPDRRNLRMHLFIKQEELLRRLYPHWRERRHAEHNMVLKNHPVDQIKENGLAYYEALRKLVRLETIEKAPNYFRYPI